MLFVQSAALVFTVWKIMKFSVTQILREIKVGEFRVSDTAILTHLEALNFDFYTFLPLLRAKNDQIYKIQSP